MQARSSTHRKVVPSTVSELHQAKPQCIFYKKTLLLHRDTFPAKKQWKRVQLEETVVWPTLLNRPPWINPKNIWGPRLLPVTSSEKKNFIREHMWSLDRTTCVKLILSPGFSEDSPASECSHFSKIVPRCNRTILPITNYHIQEMPIFDSFFNVIRFYSQSHVKYSR